VVSTLAYYEVLNALSYALRGLKSGQKLPIEKALEILRAMAGLDLEEQSVKGLEEQIFRISQLYQRTAYDAAYLALAQDKGTPLITGDKRLYGAVKERLPWGRWIGDNPSPAEQGQD